MKIYSKEWDYKDIIVDDERIIYFPEGYGRFIIKIENEWFMGARPVNAVEKMDAKNDGQLRVFKNYCDAERGGINIESSKQILNFLKENNIPEFYEAILEYVKYSLRQIKISQMADNYETFKEMGIFDNDYKGI